MSRMLEDYWQTGVDQKYFVILLTGFPLFGQLDLR
jgi:hypothetical protein